MANTKSDAKADTKAAEQVTGLTSAQIQAMIDAAVQKGKEEALKEIEAKRAEAEKASEERALEGEKKLEQEEKSTLAKLKAEKHVPILIPMSEIGDNSPVPVGINGVIYTIPRGKEFSVPESIKKQWEDSYKKTLAANARIVVKKMDEEIKITD
jgi:hypothetical protein